MASNVCKGPQIAPPSQDCWRKSCQAWPQQLASFWQRYRLVRDILADVIHAHYAASTWAGLALIAGRRPLVITVMGGDVLFDEPSTLSWSDQALTILALRHVDLVISKSEHLTRVLESFWVQTARIMKLFWGVDTELFPPVDGGAKRKSMGISEQDMIVPVHACCDHFTIFMRLCGLFRRFFPYIFGPN